MLLALTRFMTGPSPEEERDTSVERRAGYVNFGDVVAAIRLAMEPVTQSVTRLEGTLRTEFRLQTQALADRLEAHERDAADREKRIAELEAWRTDMRVARAEREGFRRTVMRGVIFVFEHPAVLLALGMTIAAIVTGVTWAALHGGAPVVEVQQP